MPAGGLNNPGAHRVELYRAQRGRCGICGDELGTRRGGGYNFDHVWSRRRYGYQNRGNLLLAHTACNAEKGGRDPTGCEVIMLAAVNAILGLRLVTRAEVEAETEQRQEKTLAERMARTTAHEARVADAQWRRAQRNREKLIEHVRRKFGPDVPILAPELPPRPVPTRREAAERPAVLATLDEAFAGIASSYRRQRLDD